MIYLYDKAIADDLSRCVDPAGGASDIVKVVESEGIMPLIAQMKEDKISFPLLCLMRHPDTPLDTERANFTRLHKGVSAAYDSETHMLYKEKVLPIELNYDLSILTTNTADMDELLKEVLFKYTSTYFITMDLPYECKRKIRFGVAIDAGAQVQRKSGSLEYIQSGTLYETIVPLRIEGAVLVSYTPVHITRMELDAHPVIENK